MTLRRSVEQIVDVLEPCLKEGTGRHSMHYETAWGWKTKEGVRNSIQTILEQETTQDTTTLPPEELSYDEAEQEVKQCLERVIALRRYHGFMPEYRANATNEECLGIALSHFFEWSGDPIMRVAYEGLTDANFHTEASVIELFLDAEDSQALAQKIFEEN